MFVSVLKSTRPAILQFVCVAGGAQISSANSWQVTHVTQVHVGAALERLPAEVALASPGRDSGLDAIYPQWLSVC